LRSVAKVSPRCVRVLPDRQTWHTGSMRQCIAGSPGVSSPCHGRVSCRSPQHCCPCA
jgi:hypothetical protein